MLYRMDHNFCGTKLLQMSANLRTWPRRNCPEEEQTTMVEKLTGFSFTFWLVSNSWLSYMLQPAEKPPVKV